MADEYCPFMGRKGRPWNELDLPTIAGRVAEGVPAEVADAVRKLASACKDSGVSPDRARELLEEELARLSAPSSRRGRRR